jgi:hypothetical protein
LEKIKVKIALIWNKDYDATRHFGCKLSVKTLKEVFVDQQDMILNI